MCAQVVLIKKPPILQPEHQILQRKQLTTVSRILKSYLINRLWHAEHIVIYHYYIVLPSLQERCF